MILSVVIPTRDRQATLKRTLSLLAAQKAPAAGVEIVVVDNGSQDGTASMLEALSRTFPIPLRALCEPQVGPAAARNRGVAAARGKVILFLGDDNQPAHPDLLERHAALHEARSEGSYAVLGRVIWHPAAAGSPLMTWLDHGGPQFGFGELGPGPVSASNHFYTAHVSVARAFLEGTGGFDERFPYAALEDIELGARLEGQGLRLEYHPELVTLHDHPIALGESLERMRHVGRSAALYHRAYPQRPHPRIGRPVGRRWEAAERVAPLLARLGELRLPRGPRELIWRVGHLAAYRQGYREDVAPTSTPNASVEAVVVNWNTPLAAVEAARALQRSRGVEVRVTIVDNGSSPHEQALLRLRAPPDVRLLLEPINRGYGTAANQGLLGSSADVVCVLNADVVVASEAVSHLAAVALKGPDVGLTGPRFQDAANHYHSRLPSRVALLLRPCLGSAGRWHPPLDSDCTAIEVDQPAGACLVARAEVWRSLGGFDETYFLWYEDVDLALRARQAGLRNLVVPQARAFHAAARSIGRLDPIEHQALRLRSLRHYAGKHHPRLAPFVSLSIAAAIMIRGTRLGGPRAARRLAQAFGRCA